MYYHLGWPHLPKLALKLRVITEQLNQGYSPHNLLADEDTLSLLAQLSSVGDFVITSHLDKNSPNQFPLLEESFHSIANLLSQFPVSLTGNGQIAPLLMSALHTSLKQPICRSCVKQSPCQWIETSRIADDDNLDRYGFCIAPLKEMFDYATEITRAVYNLPCPAVMRWSTSHRHEKNQDLDIAIAAETRELGVKSNGLFEREIITSFYLDDFAIGDYLACLYAVFHEVFVHGWCGIEIGSTASTASEDFHDGWMDYIAVDILKKALIKTHPLAISTSIIAYNAIFIRRTDEVNSYRMDIFRKNRPKNIWKWAAGAEAANTLRQLFGKAMDCDQDKAHQLFLSFSMALNRSNASHELRHHLVNKINWLYSKNTPVERGQALLEKPKVVDCILAFANSKDARQLAESLLLI